MERDVDHSLRAELVARLRELGVEHRVVPGRVDGFAALVYGGKDFAHFHDDNELDIRLTRTVIEREGLVHPPGSKNHPKRGPRSPWIEVRFTRRTDLERVVDLVKIAITQLDR
jgi:hypothetical protein